MGAPPRARPTGGQGPARPALPAVPVAFLALAAALAGCAQGPAGVSSTGPAASVDLPVPAWEMGHAWAGRIALPGAGSIPFNATVDAFEPIFLGPDRHEAVRIVERAQGPWAGGNRSHVQTQWFDRTTGALLRQMAVVTTEGGSQAGEAITRLEFDRPCPQLWGRHTQGEPRVWTCAYTQSVGAEGSGGAVERVEYQFTATLVDTGRATPFGLGAVLEQTGVRAGAATTTQYVLVPGLCTPALIARPGEERVLDRVECGFTPGP